MTNHDSVSKILLNLFPNFGEGWFSSNSRSSYSVNTYTISIKTIFRINENIQFWIIWLMIIIILTNNAHLTYCFVFCIGILNIEICYFFHIVSP